MDDALDRKVFLWTLIGPFCLAAFMALLFAKGGEAHEPFIWAALISLPLSYQGKQTGIALIFGLLSLGIVYFVWKGNDFGLWEYGLVISLILTFIVTALSFEELRVVADEVNEKLRGSIHVEEKYYEQLKFAEDKGQSELKRMEELLFAKRAEWDALVKKLGEEERSKQQLRESLGALQDKSASDQQEIEQLKKSLIQIEEALLAEKKKGDEHMMRQAVLAEMSDHIETLSREKGLLEKTLVRLQTELEDLQAKQVKDDAPPLMDVAISEPIAPCPEMIATEARLKQLKDQFREKSSILDATRKELFYAQEKIAILQKELEELQHFERNEIDVAFVKLLKEMDSELRVQESRHEHEVDSLHSIVTRLIGE